MLKAGPAASEIRIISPGLGTIPTLCNIFNCSLENKTVSLKEPYAVVSLCGCVVVKLRQLDNNNWSIADPPTGRPEATKPVCLGINAWSLRHIYII